MLVWRNRLFIQQLWGQYCNSLDQLAQNPTVGRSDVWRRRRRSSIKKAGAAAKVVRDIEFAPHATVDWLLFAYFPPFLAGAFTNRTIKSINGALKIGDHREGSCLDFFLTVRCEFESEAVPHCTAGALEGGVYDLDFSKQRFDGSVFRRQSTRPPVLSVFWCVVDSFNWMLHVYSRRSWRWSWFMKWKYE